MGFPSRAAYETIIYRLVEDYPQVRESTLRLYSTSALTAIVEGSIHFHNDVELRVVEVLDFKSSRIQRYSYTVFRHAEKIRWYDPEPHPNVPELASTFPHHLHEPPDIKHNRKPAPGINFASPNLATLIYDCSELGAAPDAGENA